MSARNPLLDAALAYASRGWAVFPCNPKNKAPLVKPNRDAAGNEIPDSGGVKRASIDPDVIVAWWREWPNAMIGLACGRAAAVFVLDLDVEDDPDGAKLAALIRRLEAELGAALPATWVAVTPRGGRHVYFDMPAGEPIGNRSALLGKDSRIDVRGEGGYVILPPSARPDGRSYQWEPGFAPAGKDAVPANAPAPLLDCIRRTGKWAPALAAPVLSPASAAGARPRPPLRLVEAPDVMAAGDEAVARYAEAALGREVAAVAGAGRGERNNTLNIAALRLGEFVAQNELDPVRVRRELENAADACGLVKEDGLRAVRRTIESGLGDGMRKGKRDLGPRLAEVRREGAARAAAIASIGGTGGAPPDDAAPPPDPSLADGPLPEIARERRPRLVAGANGKAAPPSVAARGRALDRELAFYPLTDLGNAERFAKRCHHRLLWCPVIGWHWWDGNRWSRASADEKVKAAEHAVARAIQDEAAWLKDSGKDWDVPKGREVVKFSELLAKWGRASESRKALAAMSDRAQAMLAVSAEALDADPFKINVLNGTLVVHAGPWEGDRVEFKPHNPADLITRLCPVAYDTKAQCPVYDAFLARVQPVQRVRRFLHQWSGLSLTDDVSEEKLVFFWGTGQNGKTKCVEAWAYVAGDYAQSIPIESFINEGRTRAAGQATPELAMLKGARYVYADEPERGSKLSESLIKLLTGGSKRVKVRELHMPYFNLRPTFKLTMAGNFKPRISGGDKQHAIWRRIVLVEWGVTIPEEERDYGLAQKLEAEAPGILNRMLDGLRDWCDNRLVLPQEVKDATEEYRATSDPLGRFLADCTEPAEGERVQASALHAVFQAWAKANGEREWTSTGFGRAMHERGYHSQHSNVNYWLGLRLTRTVGEFIDPATGKVRSLPAGEGAAGEDSDVVPL